MNLVFKRGGDPIFVFLTFVLLFISDVSAQEAPKIELTKEISADVGDPVAIKAKTTGKIIKWLILDADKRGIIAFPAELKNPNEMVFICKKPGNWKVLAYTALGDIPSEPAICVIKVAGGIDPVPDPDKDPLTIELQKIYNTLPQKDKAEALVDLTALYNVLATTLVKAETQAKIKNVGELRAFIVEASSRVLPVDSIRPIRERLDKAMILELPVKTSDTVDFEAVSAVFKKYHKILSGIS